MLRYQQQFTFFNAHYDTHCYLPLLGFLSFNNEPEQYLVTALLQPGNATGKTPVVVGLLERLVGLVRAAFPQATIKLRLDGGFTGPLMLAYLDSVPRLQYVCGMPKNAVLERHAEPLLEQARQLSQLTNQSAQVFGEFHRIEEAERQVASGVTLLDLVKRSETQVADSEVKTIEQMTKFEG
jgi:hypothetical protein